MENTFSIQEFKQALKILNIEDYEDRIWRSNLHGELFHLQDYILLSKLEYTEPFRGTFIKIVTLAEATWERPESVFQHILKFCEIL